MGDGTATPDPEDIIFQIRGGNVAAQCGVGLAASPSTSACRARYFGFTDDCTDRWWTFQGAGAYGTGGLSPANIYPLDGNRFVPGFDPAHIGGDNWSADAAIRFIENEPDWRGMMVSLGGIDKLGHMWGPEDEGEPGAAPGSDRGDAPPAVRREERGRAGRQDRRRAEGERPARRHADRHHRRPRGADRAPLPRRPRRRASRTRSAPRPRPESGRTATGTSARRPRTRIYRDPSPAVAQLRDALAGNLDFSYQDGHIAAWLHDNSLAKKREAAAAVLDMPGVIASYHTNAAQDDYRLFGTNPMRGAERSWFVRHGEELVDTMAEPSGPDVVGLARDRRDLRRHRRPRRPQQADPEHPDGVLRAGHRLQGPEQARCGWWT